MSDERSGNRGRKASGVEGDPHLWVSELIRENNAEAAAIAAALPAVEVNALLRSIDSAPIVAARPGVGHSALRAWVPRIAAAAATLAVVAGTLLVLRPTALPDGQIPPHLVALVDSLYPESDYIHDQMVDVMWPQRGESDTEYLDDVWETVISDIGDL